MPTTLTSAIGATPTMSNAARTFCQKRLRGRRILPLPCPTRLLFVLLPARLAASSADSVSGPSHRTASVRTRNVLVRGFISKSERAQRPSGRTGYDRKEAGERGCGWHGRAGCVRAAAGLRPQGPLPLGPASLSGGGCAHEAGRVRRGRNPEPGTGPAADVQPTRRRTNGVHSVQTNGRRAAHVEDKWPQV